MEVKVISVPLADTGLGIEAGYANDAELMEAAIAERAAQPPEIRALMDQVDAEFERRVLFGE